MSTDSSAGRIPLYRSTFSAPQAAARVIYQDADITAEAYSSATGVEMLRLHNRRGTVEVLPFLGQIVWDVHLDGIRLTMDNQFTQPQQASMIQDTYGCFAFHSGLLAAGVPGEGDDHALHGEFACAPMDDAWLTIGADGIAVGGSYEYVRGFDHHYRAQPRVILGRDRAELRMGLAVQNLSGHLTMPLQYMCQMNSAYVPGGTFVEPSPQVAAAWSLRRSVPGHVHPTEQWLRYTADLAESGTLITTLDQPELYDPEIVFLLDDLPRFGERVEFGLRRPDGVEFYTSFNTADLPVATRWILHNADQQVAAYVLPGTSRPEGREAARRAGTLIGLAPGQSRDFEVTTGLRGTPTHSTRTVREEN